MKSIHENDNRGPRASVRLIRKHELEALSQERIAHDALVRRRLF